jgi:hypothetical protein
MEDVVGELIIVVVAPVIGGVPINDVSDRVVLRVGGVTVVRADSLGGFLLRRDLLLWWNVIGWWGVIVVVFIIIVAAHPSLLRRRRGLLHRLLFFLIGILTLVLLESHWTPPPNGLSS